MLSHSTSSLTEVAQQTRQAAQKLAVLSTEERDRALEAIAQSMASRAETILVANRADCEAALAEGLAKPLYGRLKLDENKLKGAIAGVRQVGRLSDPLGHVQIHRELDQGLVLQRITCPLGVLGVIFESRPDAVPQIAALAIKSGNGVILKGGKESVRSCEALIQAIHQGLQAVGIDPAVVQLLTTREETMALLQLNELVDLIIPRGSNSFVQFVQQNTQIPVLGHAEGICHLYVDEAANREQAIAIAIDAKTQYPSACNTIETLLVHQQIAPIFLPQVATALQSEQVELRGDQHTLEILQSASLPFSIKPCSESDWATEYCDLILSMRVVDSVEEAIAHINTYGSRHTEAIVTDNVDAARQFMSRVDAASVFHNCSTRFADGFRYGFGAEVGISTQKMPPRGPVGLEGLITYKYHLHGNGHIVADYAGADAKPFTHRDL